MLKISALVLAASLAAGAEAAATGDAYVYRISNGYNNEVRGKISYRVDKVDAERVDVSVTTDTPSAGSARTESYAKNGSWLRRALPSHDQLRDFEFQTALPVYAPPGETSGAWTARVDAVDAATGQRNSVRVDGEVLGNERVTVPAGTFDTVKIMRRTYAGDWDGFMRETHIVDIDWYSPALGRPVKTESKSSWLDMSRCGRGGCRWFRGDWNIYELAEISPARP